jgi:hypothetical protein
MVGTRYMNKVKIEGEDGDYPLVNTSAGRDIRIRQHPFDIPHIDFYYKIPNSNKIEAQGAKRMIEAVDFYSLSLSVMEQNRL